MEGQRTGKCGVQLGYQENKTRTAGQRQSGKRVKTLAHLTDFYPVCGEEAGGSLPALQSHVPAAGGQGQQRLLGRPAALFLTCKNQARDFRSRKEQKRTEKGD